MPLDPLECGSKSEIVVPEWRSGTSTAHLLKEMSSGTDQKPVSDILSLIHSGREVPPGPHYCRNFIAPILVPQLAIPHPLQPTLTTHLHLPDLLLPQFKHHRQHHLDHQLTITSKLPVCLNSSADRPEVLLQIVVELSLVIEVWKRFLGEEMYVRFVS